MPVGSKPDGPVQGDVLDEPQCSQGRIPVRRLLFQGKRSSRRVGRARRGVAGGVRASGGSGCGGEGRRVGDQTLPAAELPRTVGKGPSPRSLEQGRRCLETGFVKHQAIREVLQPDRIRGLELLPDVPLEGKGGANGALDEVVPMRVRVTPENKAATQGRASQPFDAINLARSQGFPALCAELHSVTSKMVEWPDE